MKIEQIDRQTPRNPRRETRVVKVEQGTARRVGYAEAAVEAASVRTQEIEDTRLVTEGARYVVRIVGTSMSF